MPRSTATIAAITIVTVMLVAACGKADVNTVTARSDAATETSAPAPDAAASAKDGSEPLEREVSLPDSDERRIETNAVPENYEAFIVDRADGLFCVGLRYPYPAGEATLCSEPEHWDSYSSLFTAGSKDSKHFFALGLVSSDIEELSFKYDTETVDVKAIAIAELPQARVFVAAVPGPRPLSAEGKSADGSVIMRPERP